MNSVYQTIQSEYLLWLALCYSPIEFKNVTLIKKISLQVVDSVNSHVEKYYCDLNFQYTNFCGTRNCDILAEKQVVSDNQHIHVLEDGVYNIIQYLTSLTKEAQSLKLSLPVGEDRESKVLLNSLKLFGSKLNKFKIQLQNANEYIFKVDSNLKQQITTIISNLQLDADTKNVKKQDLKTTLIAPESVDTNVNTNNVSYNQEELRLGLGIRAEASTTVTNSDICTDTYPVADWIFGTETNVSESNMAVDTEPSTSLQILHNDSQLIHDSWINEDLYLDENTLSPPNTETKVECEGTAVQTASESISPITEGLEVFNNPKNKSKSEFVVISEDDVGHETLSETGDPMPKWTLVKDPCVCDDGSDTDVSD